MEEAVTNAWKYSRLLSEYYISVETTTGCGARGQEHIDAAYNKLVEFRDKHPEINTPLPEKHLCIDDGYGGAASVNFGNMVTKDCSIQ
jgi:hypothetical protein